MLVVVVGRMVVAMAVEVTVGAMLTIVVVSYVVVGVIGVEVAAMAVALTLIAALTLVVVPPGVVVWLPCAVATPGLVVPFVVELPVVFGATDAVVRAGVVGTVEWTVAARSLPWSSLRQSSWCSQSSWCRLR